LVSAIRSVPVAWWLENHHDRSRSGCFLSDPYRDLEKLLFGYDVPTMNRTELAEFLVTGVAMLGATADAGLAPEAFRAWGASLGDDGRLRVLVSSDAARTLATVGPGTPISLVFTDITTFRSVQVKGRAVAGAAAAGPADVGIVRRYHEAFSAALKLIGHPPLLAASLRPTLLFAVCLDIEELYDQTPGPKAGAHLSTATHG
jgi:hypothetical protein